MTDLKPASQKLLREIARRDKAGGVVAKYLSRGRYHLRGGTGVYNRQTFYPLFDQGLVSGWDGEDDPIRITDAGRAIVAQLDEQPAAKKPRPKPDAESPAALRALRTLAELPQPVTPHRGDRRGIWSLGGRDGYSARELTFVALEKAGYVYIHYGAHLSVCIEITDAGRQRIAARPTS